ncbi:hypothetical protein [Paramuribaculum intestinale]|uniref:hypothetical protein n=1 Tax=Paramuribaculum intestinale TaxID=2094151 RepID=UPI0025A9E8D6|nr:hypothetical protein [Paramuribaculum intestinale]
MKPTATTPEKPAMAILREMEVGDSHKWPGQRTAYITSLCSRINFEWRPKRFTARRVRTPEANTITVTRTA